MTQQTEVQNAETRLLALLNKLKTDGDVEVIKLGTKGAINSLVNSAAADDAPVILKYKAIYSSLLPLLNRQQIPCILKTALQ